MRLSEINPFVRFARVHKKPISSAYIVAPDHRLFLCVEGEGVITVGDRDYPMRVGTLLMIRAGVAYKGKSTAGTTLLAYNFDLMLTPSSTETPISYLPSDAFRDSMRAEPEHYWISELTDDLLYVPSFYERERLDEIIVEYDGKRSFHTERCGALLKDVIISAVRRAHSDTAVGKGAEILAYLREHYAEPLDNESVAAHFSYHKNYVNQILKSELGETLHGYLLRYRIERATALLSSGEYSVAEVATLVGFADLSHFSRAFKKITGLPPRALIPWIRRGDRQTSPEGSKKHL